MKTIIKLGLAGIAAGAAYYLSKQDIQVGDDGIQRFSTKAHGKVLGILSRSEGANTAASNAAEAGGRFVFTVNPHPDGSGPHLLPFVNGVMSDGFKALVSKNILDDSDLNGLQSVLVATTVEDAFDLGAKGSDFVML